MRKKLAALFWRPIVQRYLRKPRPYRYGSLRITVQPGVFHPGFFFSTRYLLEFLGRNKTLLTGKSVLELGAGSGLISLFAAQHGAGVTASDISTTAVENIRANAKANGLNIDVLHSDLFSAIPQQVFDTIVINPPYYKKNPATEAEQAWYCGEQLEYFARLFSQLPAYCGATTTCLVILSEDCDIAGIRALASEKNISFHLREEKKIKWEMNYIFELRR